MIKQVRRQHTVSRFYLNGFSDDSDLISRTELPDAKQILMSTSSASVIKDFYSIYLPDGTRSDAFERHFSTIEGAASSALRKIVDGVWPLSPEDKESLSLWISLQYLRGEKPRADQTFLSGELTRLIVGVAGKEALRRHIEAAENRPIGDSELDHEWSDLTKPGGPDLDPDINGHIRILLDVWPQMTAHLQASHWTLVRFKRRSVVTSDHPVTMSVDRDYPEDMGVGIATADMFSIPLNRRLILNIQPRRRLEQFSSNPESLPDIVAPGTTSIADSVNQQTVMQARKYIYQHPADSLSPRIHLTKHQNGSRMTATNVDSMILEEGLPAPKDASGRSVPSFVDSEDKGISLSDLEWPIPGRRSRPFT